MLLLVWCGSKSGLVLGSKGGKRNGGDMEAMYRSRSVQLFLCGLVECSTEIRWRLFNDSWVCGSGFFGAPWVDRCLLAFA